MQKIVSLIAILLISLSTFAQNVPLSLLSKIEHERQQQRQMHLFVKGDLDQIEEQVNALGGWYKYGYEDVCSITLPVDQVLKFSELEAVKRIEDGEVKVQLLNDVSITLNNVLPVHQGVGLPQGYEGEGVVMGIVDAGIDYSHPDFLKANGKTRIQFLWDMAAGGSNPSSPQPYGYGTEWNSQEIDAGQCTHVEPSIEFSHGTNITGIAAGNGQATGHFKGMAPKSDLVIVGFDYSAPFLASIVDAVDYIYKKADAMGKPCVVNLSLGTYMGSHDGKDIASQIIDFLLDERPGRVAVASAGNAGDTYLHLGYDVTQDSAFTWFQYFSQGGFTGVFFEIWSDSADFANVDFSIGADNPNNNYQFLGRLPYQKIGDMPLDGTITTDVLNDDQGNFIGTVRMRASLNEGVYQLEVEVTPSSSAYYWRFITKGEGRVDCWSNLNLTGTSNMVKSNLPSDTLVPEISTYKLPDNEQNIVSSFQCSPKVITVGNYTNRSWYYDVDSNIVSFPVTQGDIAASSSKGPTRTGLTKPDITASGSNTLTTGNLSTIAVFLTNSNRNKVAPGAMHMRNGGTSSSAPVVSGACALLLQQNPNYTWEALMQSVILSAKQDTFTGFSLPDNTWGHGKLDAHAMFSAPLVFGCNDPTALNYNPNANVNDGSCIPTILGCTDTTALNYNPLATVDDGSCVPIIYGCTDSLALNYDSTATVNDGSCLYVSGLIPSDNNSISIYPNPATDMLILEVDGFNSSILAIYNLVGEEVSCFKLETQNSKLSIDISDFPRGMYLYEISIEKQILQQGKLIFE